MSSAWPVPTATTFTQMLVASVNRGSKYPNRPDCSVDVVEATVIVRSCALAGGEDANIAAVRAARILRPILMCALGVEGTGSPFRRSESFPEADICQFAL